jgi:hypothetical protein
MKRNIYILFSLIVALSIPITTANSSEPTYTIQNANSQLKSWDIVLSQECKGRVDYPHISRHIKGSVNIILSLNCPKEFASITGVFFRDPVKVPADLKFGHVSGRDKVKMNLAVPCKSNYGISTNNYFVTATFLATKHLPVIKTFSWPVPC